MSTRPTLLIVALALGGAALLLLAGPHALAPVYLPAGLGAFVALVAGMRLLRELRLKERASMAIGASVLGFLAGGVSGVGPFPGALAYAAAFLPLFLVFVAGLGGERIAHELARLEGECDDPAARPRVLARAVAIREEARAAARALDAEASGSPAHAGDPRAIYAYAAEVIAFTRALDQDWAAAIAALSEVPIAWMPAPMRPLMVSNLGFFHLAAQDAPGAMAALDRLPEKDAAAEHRPALRAARALALVHLDRAEEALAIVGRDDRASLPPDRLRPRYALVRAAALHARGEDEAARAAIAAAVASPDARDELRRFRPALPAQAAALLDAALDEARG